MSADETLRTSFDDLFAFTSTLYKQPGTNRMADKIFYFTRYDAKDLANDFLLVRNTYQVHIHMPYRKQRAS